MRYYRRFQVIKLRIFILCWNFASWKMGSWKFLEIALWERWQVSFALFTVFKKTNQQKWKKIVFFFEVNFHQFKCIQHLLCRLVSLVFLCDTSWSTFYVKKRAFEENIKRLKKKWSNTWKVLNFYLHWNCRLENLHLHKSSKEQKRGIKNKIAKLLVLKKLKINVC